MASAKRPEIQNLIQSAAIRLQYTPNEDQLRLLSALAAYAVAREPADVFLLNGYAGTGKSSLMGAFIKALNVAGIHTILLAPTGRAAKVASAFSGDVASTIHHRIFRPLSNQPDAGFFLAPNTQADTIFIVDEASLVTDSSDTSRSLLHQLLKHIYAAPGCGLIFMGDTAQLPPVGREDSPAMSPVRLRQLGLNPICFNLDSPVRQAAQSGILKNATLIRRRVEAFSKNKLAHKLPLPILSVKDFDDVEAISSADLADYISSSWAEVGAEETILITRSNRRANNYNLAVRNIVMMAEEPLVRGDRLVISKNDYYWSKINKLKSFIANGEVAVVEWIGSMEQAYGLSFSDVELYFPSGNVRVGAKLMLQSLTVEGPALPKDDMNMLFTRIIVDDHSNQLADTLRIARENPFYNSLQAKYAYCVTCHKAQGGQWKHVYIDLAGIAAENMNESFYRWLYTAVTRATQKLFIINSSLPTDAST